nr:HAD hydrolase family protein [Yersinia enterocolitica]
MSNKWVIKPISVSQPSIASKCYLVVVTKGAALERLSHHLDLTLADCMAFGDAMNDKEMLSRVGRGLVMGNALPQLKQELPQLQVIGRCEEQGVAHYLQHWLSSPHLTYSPEF